MSNTLFTKGQNVKVIGSGFNCLKFNVVDRTNSLGIYSIKDWKNTLFQIEGTVKLIEFDSNPNIYCAYLLSYEGENIGYVYNTGLQAINDIIVFNEMTKVGINTGINYISLVAQKSDLDKWVSNNINAIWDNKNNCLKDNWYYYSESYLDKRFDLVSKFKL